MNESGGLISIIMPSYNAKNFIGPTIESVLSQSYKNWELIVIDDCSTDGTPEIVNTYAARDERIRQIKLEHNHGAPAAPRNIGVRAAQGEWVALLDSDDIWHPRKLEFQMKHLSESGAEFCSTQMRDFINTDDIEFTEPNNISIEKITFQRQLRRYRTPTSSIVMKKKLLESNPFNEDLRYKAREDFDCWLRIHERIDHSIKLGFPFLHYRLVQGQISGSKITMAKRTLLVLGEYKLVSGKQLGWRKYLYVFTHIAYSLYYRILKKAL